MNKATGDARNLVQVGRARDINVTTPTAPPTALRGMRSSTPSFTGRVAELDELAAAPFVVISGMAGVGKTELVLRFAEEFAGDQLFCDFHGYDNHGRTAGEALKKLLHDLGVRKIPSDDGNRESLFRTCVADREPMLIVLDNVSSASQVRPLLVPGHRIVVTSRHRLTGLDGAHHLTLAVLPTVDAITLVGAEELAALCGNLPLALQIMAALQRSDPDNDWITDLRDARLGTLEHDGEAVRAAFDLSYRSLPAEHQKLFLYLGMHPGDEVTVKSVAALLDRQECAVRKLLRDLRTAHLLESDNRMHDLVRCYTSDLLEMEPGPMLEEAFDRLLRHFTAHSEEPVQNLEEHLEQHYRLVKLMGGGTETKLEPYTLTLQLVARGWRLETMDGPHGESIANISVVIARSAGHRDHEMIALINLGLVRNSLDKYEEACLAFEDALRIASELGEPDEHLNAIGGYAEALIKLGRGDEAVPMLVRAIEVARRREDQHQLVQLTVCLSMAHVFGNRFDEGIDRLTSLLDCAEDDGSVHHGLGIAYYTAGRPAESVEHFTRAVTLFDSTGSPKGKAHALLHLGLSLHLLGRHDERERAWRDALKIAESGGFDSMADALRTVLQKL